MYIHTYFCYTLYICITFFRSQQIGLPDSNMIWYFLVWNVNKNETDFVKKKLAWGWEAAALARNRKKQKNESGWSVIGWRVWNVFIGNTTIKKMSLHFPSDLIAGDHLASSTNLRSSVKIRPTWWNTAISSCKSNKGPAEGLVVN
jgi:hypothetical protein